MPEPAADLTAAWAGRRVVLAHDWLTGMRGGEKVLEVMCRVFPGADLLVLVHRRGSVSRTIESRRIRTSIVQRLPSATRLYRQYLPFFPFAVEQFDLDEADVMISTSSCAVKSVIPTGRARHLCYCHSPMRYAWDQFDAYFGPDRLGDPGSALARHVLARLARWDRDTAHRVDRFVANSRHVAARIARYYNRRATVLHPPVDTRFFTPDPAARQSYFLVVSALVPYKRIDIAIDAAGRLGAPLVIVGSGPDEGRLRARAGSTVRFAGALEGEALRDHYRQAFALVLPGEEDFGIAPVEAMACGRPVIALGRGGATETVRHGVTGTLVDDLRVDAFADAMDAVERAAFDAAAIRRHAEQFSEDRFEQGFREAVRTLIEAPAAC